MTKEEKRNLILALIRAREYVGEGDYPESTLDELRQEVRLLSEICEKLLLAIHDCGT